MSKYTSLDAAVDGDEAATAELAELRDAGMQQIAAEAYQVIGVLASDAGLFDKPGVQKALTYFSDVATGNSPDTDILPWWVDG